MSDSPSARRRTALWHSFMPSEAEKVAEPLASWRVEAGQTLRLHIPETVTGICEYCEQPWVCGAALWAAFLLELLG